MKIYKAFPNAYRIGVTATPERLDGSGLCDVNDDLIVGVSAKWLIENQYLSPYEYYAPTLVDLEKVRVKQGDYDEKQVEEMMIKRAVFGDVIAYYNRLAKDKQAICYCTTVKHSKAMMENFNENGITAAHIDGETPKLARDMLIERFRQGKIKVLCNVDLISEGFDVPDCECAILLRPTKSLTLYIQQSMRCMRYKDGKTAVIIDHVGNYARHGLPDSDREWTLDGKAKQEKNVKKPVALQTCPNCFEVFPKYDKQNKLIRVCPYCHYVLPIPKKQEIEEIRETTLQKITDFVVNYDSSEECGSYQELLLYAKRKGYKKGWAYYQAKARGFIT